MKLKPHIWKDCLVGQWHVSRKKGFPLDCLLCCNSWEEAMEFVIQYTSEPTA